MDRPLLQSHDGMEAASRRRSAGRKLVATAGLLALGLAAVAASAAARGGEGARSVELFDDESRGGAFAAVEGSREERFGRPLKEEAWERRMDMQMMESRTSRLWTNDGPGHLPPSICYEQPDRCTGRSDWDALILTLMVSIVICVIAISGACSLSDKSYIRTFEAPTEDGEEGMITAKYSHGAGGLSMPTPLEQNKTPAHDMSNNDRPSFTPEI